MELTGLIKTHYPTASFTLRRGVDDPDATYITATVDVEDPDEVLDLVVDRLLELQLADRLPVYVLPVHPPERVARTMHQVQGRTPSPALQEHVVL